MVPVEINGAKMEKIIEKEEYTATIATDQEANTSSLPIVNLYLKIEWNNNCKRNFKC